MEDMEKVRFSVIGAGIIGIMTALELKKSCSGEVVLFDREMYFGEHSSGRNSGVIHSGIYYRTNSLKHLHCLSGKKLWATLSREMDIPLKTVGKYIFASASQEDRLAELHAKGMANGVGTVCYASPAQLTALNRFVDCSKAIWIPDVAIIDQSAAMKIMLQKFEDIGGIYLPQHSLSEVQESKAGGFELKFENGLGVVTQALINCGGLFGVDIRKKLSLNDLENYWVKGNYIQLNKKISDIVSLLYPMPEANLKGLGVHLTMDMANNLRFGPNTEDVESIDYKIRDGIVEKMKEYVAKTYKNISVGELNPDYCGIRSKILKSGTLYDDFWIERPLPNYYECLGIESPGFTAAPSIARHLAAQIQEEMVS